MQKRSYSQDNSWIKILDKGMVTIPKKFREKFNFRKGDMLKIRLENNQLIIEPTQQTEFRDFSNSYLKEMLKDDALPFAIREKATKYLRNIP